MTDMLDSELESHHHRSSTSGFFPVKFIKKKELVTVDWKSINRKLEDHYKIKEIQMMEEQDLLVSLYDESGGASSKLRRDSILNPSSVKKLRNMVQQKRENKRENNAPMRENEVLKEFQAINEILENKRTLREKELQKLLLNKSPERHYRQK